MRERHTKTVDGYRWLLAKRRRSMDDATQVYSLEAQKRCTTDSGAVYFAFTKATAEFDTPEARAKFMKQWSARDWVAA
jgi:hypothetical protein